MRIAAGMLGATTAAAVASCQPLLSTQGTTPSPTVSPMTLSSPSAPPATSQTGSPSAAPTPTPEVLVERPVQVILTAASTGAITVLVRDAQFNPVRTDLWFFKQSGSEWVPMSEISSLEGNRRSANFMLPKVVDGKTTGFTPANDGGKHGIMTDTSDRTKIDGKVDVTIGGISGVASGSRILIAAALEDQRYYGARVFELPSGTPGDAPLHAQPQSFRKRTYDADIKPLLEKSCVVCHSSTGPVSTIPLTSYRDLVERNFKAAPGKEFEAGPGEFVTEPGAPALAALVRRTMPGLGAEAKKWYGKSNKRYNLDSISSVSTDRRMPPESTASVTADSDGPAAYFDTHFAEYQILWEWVSQGAPEN